VQDTGVIPLRQTCVTPPDWEPGREGLDERRGQFAALGTETKVIESALLTH
jgi:hypothetical protein